MPRRKRVWFPHLYSHVVMRGNNRQNIFNYDRDFQEFFRILSYTYEKYPFILSAYCIMTNHYHLLIRSPEVPLSKIMSIVNRRYSDYYKKRYHYTGQLYESRFYSELVSTPMSMLRVSRYIHRNPINTKTPMVNEIEEYPYSSYPIFKTANYNPYSFVNINPLIECFQYPFLQTIEDYFHFCEEDPEDDSLDVDSTQLVESNRIKI